MKWWLLFLIINPSNVLLRTHWVLLASRLWPSDSFIRHYSRISNEQKRYRRAQNPSLCKKRDIIFWRALRGNRELIFSRLCKLCGSAQIFSRASLSNTTRTCNLGRRSLGWTHSYRQEIPAGTGFHRPMWFYHVKILIGQKIHEWRSLWWVNCKHKEVDKPVIMAFDIIIWCHKGASSRPVPVHGPRVWHSHNYKNVIGVDINPRTAIWQRFCEQYNSDKFTKKRLKPWPSVETR